MVNQIQISKDIFDFMKNQNDTIQEDPEKALKSFADFIGKTIANAIRSADIIIPPSQILVVNPAIGPSTNAAPIVLKKTLK